MYGSYLFFSYKAVDGPHFLGHIISHLVLDRRDKKTLLAAAKTGHLGPTIFRSTDWGGGYLAESGATTSLCQGKRQAMCCDSHDPVGLYFGTTSGELWTSCDEGQNWECIARHLPEIYAVEALVI